MHTYPSRNDNNNDDDDDDTRVIERFPIDFLPTDKNSDRLEFRSVMTRRLI